MSMEQLCVDLELTVQALTKDLVKRFNEYNLGYINLNIEVKGSTHGDVVIEYRLGRYNDSTDYARGNRIMPMIEEYLRRHQWNLRNAPTLLTFDGSGDLKTD